MAKLIDSETNAINLLGIGTEIKGEITSNNDIRIDGTLTGNLNTKGKLVIGESGIIAGEIHCKNSDVEGKVEGKIFVSELLSLKATSVIKGDITARKLAIEPGAKFSGNCNMNLEQIQTHAAPGKESGKESQETTKH